VARNQMDLSRTTDDIDEEEEKQRNYLKRIDDLNRKRAIISQERQNVKHDTNVKTEEESVKSEGESTSDDDEIDLHSWRSKRVRI